MEKRPHVYDTYMQTPRFVLALRTRVPKNKIPDGCNLSNEALVQGQLHQKKLIIPGTAFLACGRCPDMSIKHAFACTAASDHVLCHTGTVLCVPSRQSASNPRHIPPLGCARHPCTPLCRAVHFGWHCQLIMK